MRKNDIRARGQMRRIAHLYAGSDPRGYSTLGRHGITKQLVALLLQIRCMLESPTSNRENESPHNGNYQNQPSQVLQASRAAAL